MGNKSIFRYKQFDIVQEHAAMKVGTDSDLLGTLAAGGTNILDIGTGTGIISLMMAQRFPDAKITAIDIDENAIQDASVNFANSPFSNRLSLTHISFQDFLEDTSEKEAFDCVVCNPPYFDKSLECDNLSKTRARHSSSLPFHVLIKGAYDLLVSGGVFSVCIPPEVLEDFSAECLFCGFWLKDIYKIKSVPEKEPKRYVLVHQKGNPGTTTSHTFSMRNSDKTRSDWYNQQLKDFLQ